jgi:hypothetical protein
MINKKTLAAIIDKYYLKGLCDSAVWKIENNFITIDFITRNSDMIGSIKMDNFPLSDTELAIYDTSLLDRQLQITSGDLRLNVIKSNKINTKLILEDSQFNIQFSLADKTLIPPVAQVTEPEIYSIEADLDFEAISAMIRAKNALQKIDTVSFTIEKNLENEYDLIVNFGDTNNYANRIIYTVSPIINNGITNLQLVFSLDILKEVLDANKNASSAQLYLLDKGLLKLHFTDDNIDSEYFLVCREA